MAEFSPVENLRSFGTNIVPDLVSGLTVAVIALPLALAFGAMVPELGPAAGIWAAIVGGVVVGIFGGCRTGVSGPTGPKVVQLAALAATIKAVDGTVDVGFIFSVVFLSGLICVALALLRVGRFIYFTPYSVVSGFMCGIGAIILITQIPPLLGFPAPSGVWAALREIPRDLSHAHVNALVVAGSTFGAILAWPRIVAGLATLSAPLGGLRRLPGPLVGLLVGTAVANLAGLEVAFIADIPVGLPEIHLPSFSRFDEMIGPAAALAGLAVFDSLLTCLVCDTMTGSRHSSDREIFGQGLANMACGLVGGVTTATATIRSVANIKCGARTGLAAVVHGLVLLALMLGLAPLAKLVPMACLAGILVKVGIDILDYRVLPVLHRMPLTDAVCFWAVLLLTISVDLLVAMGVGITIAFVRTVQELGTLYEPELASGDADAGRQKVALPEPLRGRVLKLRLEGPLFFGVADTVYRAAAKMKDYDYLLIRLEDVPMADLSGAYLLDDILEQAERQGARALLSGVRPRVGELLDRLGILAKFEEEDVCDTVDDALLRIAALHGVPPIRNLDGRLADDPAGSVDAADAVGEAGDGRILGWEPATVAVG
ncbi:SulP family inorganic anion transporter [Alienimonas californiensis]|uniref:SulP family inorganic anion transporter n=1 Tax=Alienimonas californiensis TaxID=2527989 RepID=UPI001A998BE9|nr:SulP family inorganic anion transporter [Alienimonas californiensis]